MRRRGLANALQLALGAVGGAAGGYVQDQERKRKQKEEEDARNQQRFLMRYNLMQGDARPRQAPVPGAPETPGMPQPSDYQTIGTFDGVEYEALTPEAKARRDLAAREAGIAAELDVRFKKQQEQERQRLESQRPALEAALKNVEQKYLPTSIRELVFSGTLDPKDALNIAAENRRLDIAGRPSPATPKGTFTAGEINKAIADRVADYSKFLLTATKRVPKTFPNGTPIQGQFDNVPYSAEERSALINQYRDALKKEYEGLMPTSAGSGAGASGGTGRGTGTVLPPILDLNTPGAGGNQAGPRGMMPSASAGAFSGGVSNIGGLVGQRLPQSFMSDFNRGIDLYSGRPAAPFQPFEYTDSLGRQYRIR